MAKMKSGQGKHTSCGSSVRGDQPGEGTRGRREPGGTFGGARTAPQHPDPPHPLAPAAVGPAASLCPSKGTAAELVPSTARREGTDRLPSSSQQSILPACARESACGDGERCSAPGRGSRAAGAGGCCLIGERGSSKALYPEQLCLLEIV